MSVFQEQSSKPEGNDFVEAVMFNKDQWVIMVGNLVTSAEPGKVSAVIVYIM